VPENKVVAVHDTASTHKPDAITAESAGRAMKQNEAPIEKHNSAPAAPELKPEANRAPAIQEPAGQNPNRQPARPEKPAPQENKAQQPAREKPAAHENNGANPPEKERQNEPKQP
jgi:hypothetical protein